MSIHPTEMPAPVYPEMCNNIYRNIILNSQKLEAAQILYGYKVYNSVCAIMMRKRSQTQKST